eukprot:TRINITY_DN9442_c0_g1_i4.p1 TRINITY_DN9442_c0_g1~~TRINITY_DN9442_c0_g1_i4.p1  ORF type:complete len:232 (-),score=40.10 TRINITY_DN9442_c0_g1_i4:193-888(-)
MGSVMSLRNPSYIKISLRSNIDQSNNTGKDLIHSCGAISKMLGLQRSFSCGDILTISESEPVRHTRSDTFLHECEDYTLETPDANSGTLSACIAGDYNVKSSSQLPSPDAELVKVLGEDENCYSFFYSELISSITKRPRQNYIRRRLKVIHNALEHLTDTNFNLDHIEVEVNSTEKEKSGTVSSKEIAQNRGKPLSKYERNIVIFNWLHTLDEGAVIAHDHDHEEEYLQDE